METGRTVQAIASNFSVDIYTDKDCNTNNIIYCISCIKPNCRVQYISKTKSKLKARFRAH